MVRVHNISGLVGARHGAQHHIAPKREGYDNSLVYNLPPWFLREIEDRSGRDLLRRGVSFSAQKNWFNSLANGRLPTLDANGDPHDFPTLSNFLEYSRGFVSKRKRAELGF